MTWKTTHSLVYLLWMIFIAYNHWHFYWYICTYLGPEGPDHLRLWTLSKNEKFLKIVKIFLSAFGNKLDAFDIFYNVNYRLRCSGPIVSMMMLYDYVVPRYVLLKISTWCTYPYILVLLKSLKMPKNFSYFNYNLFNYTR